MITYFDAHTHLNQERLFPDWKAHLFDFINQGGRRLINAGANTGYNERGILIAQEAKKLFPNCRVKCAVWFHPCDVEELCSPIEKEIQKLKNQIFQHREEVVAIGECGIDLHFDTEGNILALQKGVFTAQCKLAKEVHLPIVIHSRDAFEETFAVLKEFPELTIYFHCRGYSEKEIQILLATFPKLFIGFCGNTTYPKAEHLRSSLKAVPKEKILIETDAPYLSPQGFRGQTNTPAKLIFTGKFLADLLGMEEEALWQQVEKNFWNLYQK